MWEIIAGELCCMVAWERDTQLLVYPSDGQKIPREKLEQLRDLLNQLNARPYYPHSIPAA